MSDNPTSKKFKSKESKNKSIKSKDIIGLTDVNKLEYDKLKLAWETKNNILPILNEKKIKC